MSRVIRKTGTATIVITASSDTDPGYPATKFDQAEPTKVYQGGLTDDEIATMLENTIKEWAEQGFPRDIRGGILNLVSVAVVVT